MNGFRFAFNEAYFTIKDKFLNWLVPYDLFENMRFDDEEDF